MSFNSQHVLIQLEGEVIAPSTKSNIDDIFSRSTMSLIQVDPFLTGQSKWSNGPLMVIYIRSCADIVRAAKTLGASGGYAYGAYQQRLEKMNSTDFYRMVRACGRARAIMAFTENPDETWMNHIGFTIKPQFNAYTQEPTENDPLDERFGGWNCAASTVRAVGSRCNYNIIRAALALETDEQTVQDWFDILGLNTDIL